jgi:hypothetical protein
MITALTNSNILAFSGGVTDAQIVQFFAGTVRRRRAPRA